MLIPVLCASLTFSRFLTASYGLVAAATFPDLVALVVACAVSAQNEMNFGFTPPRTRRGQQALDTTTLFVFLN
jgi:hypothetical protein